MANLKSQLKFFFRSDSEEAFYYFDNQRVFHIPSLNISLSPGDSISLLGARGTDIVDIYNQFIVLDPLRLGKNKGDPIIRCINRSSDLSFSYSAYENFRMSDRAYIHYGNKSLTNLCEDLRNRLGIDFSFKVPLSKLTPSQRVIVSLIHAYLSDAEIFICGNLYSVLTLSDCAIVDSLFQIITEEEHKRILYLTTKREFAVLVSKKIVVFSDNAVLGELSSDEVIKDPQELIYLISGKTLIKKSADQDQNSIINMLYNGALYLSDNYELSGALSCVLDSMLKALNCKYSGMLLSDDVLDATARISILHYYNSINGNLIALSDTFIKAFFANKSNILYCNEETTSFDELFSSKNYDVLSLLAVPIHLRGNTVGILISFFDSPLIYDSEQYSLMNTFSKELSVIIETSKLMGSSVLLQESNHRIKNNLQIIISLISLTQSHVGENSATSIDDTLETLSNRIHNIALVHEMLSSHNDQGNLSLSTLIRKIADSYVDCNINFIIDVEDIPIPFVKVTTTAMVINELILNSVKYAFINHIKAQNIIGIRCKSENNLIIFTITDNGCGFSEDFDPEESSGLGMTLIKSLTENELHGKIEITSSHSGVTSILSFPFTS